MNRNLVLSKIGNFVRKTIKLLIQITVLYHLILIALRGMMTIFVFSAYVYSGKIFEITETNAISWIRLCCQIFLGSYNL
ncbi:MAG: hypothetical protein K0R54_681 [Clostridiaceae bacterium]|jgi:hypothetical protein|nr:hypothetical protein [Clostridiaceae bacterium]